MWTLIGISFLLWLGVSCDTSHNFDYSSCSLTMNYIDNNCNSFNLVNCTWYQCANDVYINDVKTCVDYQISNTSDWNNCLQTCCNSGSSYAQTSDGISQCQTYITTYHNRLLIFLAAVAGMVLLIFLILAIKKRCQRNQQNLEQQQNIYGSLAEENNWKEEINSTHSLSKRTVCTICMEEGSFFQLQCHDKFHRQCIIPFLKNKKECILCKRTSIEKVTVYCQKCFKFYYESSLSKFINSLTNNQQICQRCKSQNL